MILKLFMVASWAVVTMTAQELVQPNLDGLKYPVIAKSARIQGSVQYVVKSDGIQLVSGHPMLAAAAKSNLEKWAMPHAIGTPLSVTYVFRLTIPDDIPIEVDEPIGDQFDRLFLRLLHLPVTRRVKKYTCTEPKESLRFFKRETKDGLPRVEITVEDQSSNCLNTTRLAIAALRT